MNQYKSVQEIPSSFKMTNPVETSGETKKDVIHVNHPLLIFIKVINQVFIGVLKNH